MVATAPRSAWNRRRCPPATAASTALLLLSLLPALVASAQQAAHVRPLTGLAHRARGLRGELLDPDSDAALDAAELQQAAVDSRAASGSQLVGRSAAGGTADSTGASAGDGSVSDGGQLPSDGVSDGEPLQLEMPAAGDSGSDESDAAAAAQHAISSNDMRDTSAQQEVAQRAAGTGQHTAGANAAAFGGQHAADRDQSAAETVAALPDSAARQADAASAEVQQTGSGTAASRLHGAGGTAVGSQGLEADSHTSGVDDEAAQDSSVADEAGNTAAQRTGLAGSGSAGSGDDGKQDLQGDGASDAEGAAAATYQQQIIQDMLPFRPERPGASSKEGIKSGAFFGQNVEEAVFERFQTDPQAFAGAQRVYLPVFWVGLMRDGPSGWRPALQKYINSLDTSKKYWTVVHAPGGLAVKHLAIIVPPELDIVIFASGGLTPGAKNVVIPLLKGGPSPQQLPEKDHAISFIGSITASATRKALHDMYGQQWFFYTGGDSWRQHLQRSVFTICPVGFGQASFRLAEAIAAEAIPVYVWETAKMLPYQGELDWDTFAIVVHSSDIASIGDLIDAAHAVKMRKALGGVRHRFTLQSTVDYVAGFVKQNRGGPILNGSGKALVSQDTAPSKRNEPVADAADGSGGSAASAADMHGGTRAGSNSETGSHGSRGGVSTERSDTLANQASYTMPVGTKGQAGVSGGYAVADGGSGGGGAMAGSTLPADQSSQRATAVEDAAGFEDAGSSSGADARVGAAAANEATVGGSTVEGGTAADAALHQEAAAQERKEKAQAKQRLSGAASLVQKQGGLDRQTAVQNAKVLMDPQTLADGASSGGFAAGGRTYNGGSGGGGSIEASKEGSQQVAEVTAALANNGAQASEGDDQRPELGTDGTAGAAADPTGARSHPAAGFAAEDKTSVSSDDYEDGSAGADLSEPRSGAADAAEVQTAGSAAHVVDDGAAGDGAEAGSSRHEATAESATSNDGSATESLPDVADTWRSAEQSSGRDDASDAGDGGGGSGSAGSSDNAGEGAVLQPLDPEAAAAYEEDLLQ